ncbi:unnamed protein product [Phytophthora fragariaefolia]|uniref:Unnamed protein product n=1 Tax=Phytophthora fragariaefolia TaxID=1490495 RepID=A0A9W6XUN2_9STRA|nr:unnamed protein product [Phytophthora fragariaefolia]
MKGKQTVAAFPSGSRTKASRVLELVHTDVMGPMKTLSKGGAKYVLTLVDDHSRYVEAYFMKKKSEVASKLKEFNAFYETQWGERLKCIRSDNGTEFVNGTVAELCRRNGIMHQRSVPYSPQQNGVAERMNRTIMEKARSMLYYKGVSTEWWAEAVSTAVYLINRSSNAHADATPYELGFKVKPRMDHLRVFGSQGYAHIDDVKRTTLEPKSFRCMFLGYADNAKGYRVFDLERSKIMVSRSVQMADEPIQDIEMDEVEPEQEVLRLPPPNRPVSTGLELTEYLPPAANGGLDLNEERKSEGSDGPPSPKRTRIDEDGLIAEAVLAYAASIVEAADPPSTYAQAMASDEAAAWRKPMKAELRSHERNGTWTLVPRGTDIRPIGCRWVFAKKRDENGRVIRYKARLVTNGFKQKFGVDFFEAYSPVANINSIRVVLAVCVADVYVMEQLNADTQFLNSDLVDHVYMEVPFGIENARNYVCRLDKAIYGLKQAANAWNKTIHRVFLKNGFKSCGADQCVYVKPLKAAFKMLELGPAKFIIGMEIDHAQNEGMLMIKQTRHIDDVAERPGQQNAKTVENPCTSNLKLSKKQSPGTERAEMRSRPYRSLIGCLIYIATCTRPDVAFVVTQLSRFLENRGLQHWQAAIRVLRYLKSTREHGIVYQGSSGKVTVEAFTDADWGSNTDDRRSVSGIMVLIGNGPVVFKSKYQRTVALSSAEAEYMVLSLCVQEMLWTRSMLKDMGKEQEDATQIWEDNQGAIALAQNAGYHARSKHVDIRHHFIRENVENGTVKVDYIDTKRQLANMLTKSLGTKTLKYLRESTGVKSKITEQ